MKPKAFLLLGFIILILLGTFARCTIRKRDSLYQQMHPGMKVRLDTLKDGRLVVRQVNDTLVWDQQYHEYVHPRRDYDKEFRECVKNMKKN